MNGCLGGEWVSVWVPGYEGGWVGCCSCPVTLEMVNAITMVTTMAYSTPCPPPPLLHPVSAVAGE